MTLPPRKIIYSDKHSAELEDFPIRDIDEDVGFTEIFIKSRDYTMTGKPAMYALYGACKYVHEAGIPGDFVECGTWRGGSAIVAALTFEAERKKRDIWLYDTFEGMTPPTDADVDVNGNSAAFYLDQYRDNQGWCYASKDDVSANFKSAGLDDSAVRYIEGDVLQTLQEHVPKEISVLRLDTDWYESTRIELEILYPRLAPGGVLILDDYGYWSGSRKAVDEYFADRKMPYLSRVSDQVRLAIKI